MRRSEKTVRHRQAIVASYRAGEHGLPDTIRRLQMTGMDSATAIKAATGEVWECCGESICTCGLAQHPENIKRLIGEAAEYESVHGGEEVQMKERREPEPGVWPVLTREGDSWVGEYRPRLVRETPAQWTWGVEETETGADMTHAIEHYIYEEARNIGLVTGPDGSLYVPSLEVKVTLNRWVRPEGEACSV